VPNAIGFARLGLIPVFLVIALESVHGRSALAVVLFAVIGWADYLDGFAARLTGLVVSGMVVAWHFSLLPRWAIAVVVARELLMLALSRYALSRGVDIEINWAGRLGVAPTMGAPFFAMAGVHWLALVLLYVGLALSLTATALYLRRGVRELRKASSSA
jgi:cardiolipin synthase